MSAIIERTAGELRGSITHLHKDIESKAATIQHLQSALKAKNQTIDILSKSRSNGENLGAYIEEAVAEQCKSKLAEKDEEVNRLMELLHDLEERQQPSSGAKDEEKERLKEQLERLEHERQESQLEMSDLRRSLEELQRSKDNVQLEEELRELREEAEANAGKLSQFRDYQSKAFELKHSNDILSEQLDALQEEMQRMQSDYNDEVEQLKKEIEISQNDRRTHRQAVEEHVEVKIGQLRKEKNEELQEALQQLDEKSQKIEALEIERDRLRLKTHSQDLELQALQEAVGLDKTSETANEGPHREKVIALREQSQFAFDEMTKRLVEIREEGDAERKRLQADLEQQLKQRAATLVEVQNARDRAETHAEALEQSNKDLSQQRDELVKQLGEERKRSQEQQEELDLQQEHQKTQQQRHAVLSLVHALQKSAVMPAFSLLRRSMANANVGTAAGPLESQVDDTDVAVESMGGASDEEESEDDEPEESYGTDSAGQEDWAELMKANTFEACIVCADTVQQNASRAAADLQEHVSNITTSLEFFPQIYPSLLQFLEKSSKGYGRELRKFILVMQKATERAVRIASQIVELCEQNADVVAKSKSLFRMKSLDWHLKSLRTAGQHGILLRFYTNQLAAQKQAYEDVLDQYGAQCEQNTELEEKLDFLAKEKQELLNEAASLKGPKESSNDDAFKELETLRLQLEDAKKQILRLEEQKASPASHVHSLEGESSTSDSLSASQPSKGKSKGKKGPGPPPAKAASEVAADPANENDESAEQTAPAADEENATPAPAKGKGKGKKGPGPPPAKAASEVAADPANETAESAEQTAPAADGENATPAPAKGKAKGKKGPGPPPAKAASEVAADPANENAESAEQTAPAADGENATPAPAKAKGKGKKGPGPPPSKGGGGEAAQLDQTSPETSTEAPGKGKAPPKGAAKGKGKGKSALPDIDPGPAPPKDMVGKKFHWTNVLGNRFAGSMFERIVQDLNTSAKVSEEANDELERASKTLRVKLDVGVLTNFFFKRKDESETTAEVKESKKKTVAQCLSMQRSQNIEIFLNGCGINISHVKSAVLDLDEKAIDADNLGKVIEILPQGEELQDLMEFKKTNDPSILPWGRAEEFLLQLLEIPNFKVRAECCLTKSRFDSVCNEILQDVDLLHKCLSHVVDSSWLPNIFALVMQMGNYLNHGTNKGQQRGFTLDTLPLLTRVEGFSDKSYSLIRFLMDTLESDRKVKDGAMKDLELCDSAAKLDFDESVRRLTEMEKKVMLVESNLKDVEMDAFQKVMQDFVTMAQEKLSKLREQVEEVQGLSKRCCDLFAEKPKTPTGETLGKLAAFRKDMEDGRRQNLMAKVKKEKAEKRKAEQQAKAQAKRQSMITEEPKEAKAPPSEPEPSSMPMQVEEVPSVKLLEVPESEAPTASRRSSVQEVEEVPSVKLLEVLESEAPSAAPTAAPSASSASRHSSVLEGERMSMGDPSRVEAMVRAEVAQGRMTVGHAGPVLTRGSGAKAKAKPKAAQGKCFAGDLLQITKSGRLSLGPRSAAALAAASATEVQDERESLANTLRQAMSSIAGGPPGSGPGDTKTPLHTALRPAQEEMPVSLEPRESLANKIREAKAKAESLGGSPKKRAVT